MNTRRRFNSYIKLAKTLTGMGKMSDAVLVYKRALEINPNDAETYFGMGNVLKSQGKMSDAADAYQYAIALNPEYVKAYEGLSGVLNAMGKTEAAAASIRSAIRLDPDNPSMNHMLAALTGDLTDIAPRKYVKRLFDQYAVKFDSHLIKELKYNVPEMLRKNLDTLGKRNLKFRNTADLGCGTGLAGQVFRTASHSLTGVDLSPKMIVEAEKKNIYNRLKISEIKDFLDYTDEIYDLIIAADVFVYIGNLEPVFTGVQKCSKPGTFFIFSTEISDKQAYTLRQSGRYAHTPSYIRSLAKQHGFVIRHHNVLGIRKENKKWINGGIFILEYHPSR